MISKKEILKMAQDVLHRSNGKPKRSVVVPRREWFIGIGLFFVVLFAGGVYTADRYAYYSTIESTIETNAKPHKKYNSADAESALHIFQGRGTALQDVVVIPLVIDTVSSSTNAVSASTTPETENTEPTNGATSTDGMPDVPVTFE